MAIVENPNDTQNMFSKAGKITSEKYIVFQRKDEIIKNKPRYAKGSTLSQQEKDFSPEKKVNELLSPKKSDPMSETKSPVDAQIDKTKTPFFRQLSRQKGHYTKISKDDPPPCGYYHPKFSELDKAPHSVPSYEKTLKKTEPKEVPGKHGLSDNFDKPIVDRPRLTRNCFSDLKRQIDRPNIFANRPMPHEKRFEMLRVTDSWSKVPRTPCTQLSKQLSRDEMIIYKRKQYAPDYQPNFEFGKKKLGSCGASFDKLEKRKDIMVKKPEYNNEAYFEWDFYAKGIIDPKSRKDSKERDDPPPFRSQLFRTPTAPDFKRMLERECDPKSLLPCYIQKFTNNRMALTFLHQKMLEVNNFRDGRFQTVTSSFGNLNKFKKKRRLEESSEEEFEQDEQQ